VPPPLWRTKSGADFAATAAKYSDDISSKVLASTRTEVDQTNHDISPIHRRRCEPGSKAGQISGVISTSATVCRSAKTSRLSDGKIKAAHIGFNFQPITKYTNDRKNVRHQEPTSRARGRLAFAFFVECLFIFWILWWISTISTIKLTGDTTRARGVAGLTHLPVWRRSPVPNPVRPIKLIPPLFQTPDRTLICRNLLS